MAIHTSNTPLRGHSRVRSVDNAHLSDPPARHGGAPFEAAEQAAAMNAVLVTLNGLMAEGCENSAL